MDQGRAVGKGAQTTAPATLKIQTHNLLPFFDTPDIIPDLLRCEKSFCIGHSTSYPASSSCVINWILSYANVSA